MVPGQVTPAPPDPFTTLITVRLLPRWPPPPRLRAPPSPPSSPLLSSLIPSSFIHAALEYCLRSRPALRQIERQVGLTNRGTVRVADGRRGGRQTGRVTLLVRLFFLFFFFFWTMKGFCSRESGGETDEPWSPSAHLHRALLLLWVQWSDRLN